MTCRGYSANKAKETPNCSTKAFTWRRLKHAGQKCPTIRKAIVLIFFCMLYLAPINFQINNFHVDRYHPLKGCYLCDLTASRIGNLISESL